MRTSVRTTLSMAGALVALSVIVVQRPASAATINVTTTGDSINGGDGLTSLREAFAAASASGEADTIVLAAATTYNLVNCLPGELVDSGTGNLTITGNGATIHQTCAGKRVINKTQASGVLSVNDTTITSVGSAGVLDGAAILSAGRVVLDGVTITDIPNTTFGTVVEFSNVAATYDVEVIDSTITGNGGRAVDNSGIGGGVNITGSTISENSGGGIDLVDGSPLDVESSTVSDNGGYGVKSTGQGTTSLSVTDSTVEGNTNAGVSCGACGSVAVTSSIVSGNGIGATAGGGGGVSMTTDQDGPGPAPTMTITGSTITGNNAEKDGGGVSVNWIEAHSTNVAVQTSITDSTISGNTADCTGCDGGGVAVGVGSLSITGSEIDGNATSGDGGGVFQDRRNGDEVDAPTELEVTDSTISGNTAGDDGGGVFGHAAAVSIVDTLVEGNGAVDGGGASLGGIFTDEVVQSGAVTVDGSTFAANTASASGGGIHMGYPDGSNATITNSTIDGNSAAVGGGIAAGPTEPLALSHLTLTANSAATGANIAAASPTTIGRTVIAAPAGGGTNCAGLPPFAPDYESAGFSWFSDASCAAGPSDVVSPGGDPQLGALGDNGGLTPTRLPAATSPVGGLVPAASCIVPVDQRGEARPAGAGCEAGAVEVVESGAPPSGIIHGTPNTDFLVGTEGDDDIRGYGSFDVLSGLGGNDTIRGGQGFDLIFGGPGNDTLIGGPDFDILIGGGGVDTFDGGDGPDLCLPSGGGAVLC